LLFWSAAVVVVCGLERICFFPPFVGGAVA
jgi:hypothetical protein